jgi:transposase
MSLPAVAFPPIPADTARVAKAAFRRKGSIYLTIGEHIGTLFDAVDFSALYAKDGAPGLSPNLLALVLVFAFIEDLSDREAAEAVLARIDWKYALHLSLTDPGFDHSVLHDFRQRLLQHDAAAQLFNVVLARLVELGLVRPGGRQRTDGSYVLAASHQLSRLELVRETLADALGALAELDPTWLPGIAQPHWYDRYREEWASAHLPKGQAKRDALARAIGADGCYLLAALAQAAAPRQASELPEVQVLQQVWAQQFDCTGPNVQVRAPDTLPPGAELIVTPQDPEARPGQHGAQAWHGYAVHWTESCDGDLPHLITDARVVPATTPDVKVLPAIQADLAARGLLPAEQLVDAGYMAGHTLVESRTQHGIDLIGRMPAESSWQARQADGVTTEQFQFNWARQEATCPQGQVARMSPIRCNPAGQPVVDIHFRTAACQDCPLRQRCTQSTAGGRSLKVSIYHDVILAARLRQQTALFGQAYAQRAGIEGTVSQTVRQHGARRTRYLGLAKTHVQTLLTAIAINLKRAALWLMGRRRAVTRPGQLRCLQPIQLAA